MARRLGNERAWVASTLLLCALFTLSLHTRTARDTGIWRGQVAAGQALLRGEVPQTPSNPLWGYSLAAGALGDAVVGLQGALALLTLALWYALLRRLRRREFGGHGASSFLLNPLIFLVAMVPWLLLIGSYYSNSLSAILALAGTTVLVWALSHRASR